MACIHFCSLCSPISSRAGPVQSLSLWSGILMQVFLFPLSVCFFLIAECEAQSTSSEAPKFKESCSSLLLYFHSWPKVFICLEITLFTTKWKYQCRNIKELSLRQWGKHIPVPLSSLGDLISLRNTRASSMSALALKSPRFLMKLLVGLGLSKQSQRDSFCVMHEIQVMRSIILCITNSHCINLSFTFFLLLLAGYHILLLWYIQ